MIEEQVRDLITELRRIGRECTWAEFKCDNDNPEMIAEYVSAMSNSAAMDGVEYGYVVWGLRDVTLDIVGTTFKPTKAKKGNEPLMNWLVRSTQPHLDIEFGAILFAKNLNDFGRLGRKAIRIVKYTGNGRLQIERQWEGPPSQQGYAMSFEAAVAFVKSQVEQNEPIGQALRTKVQMYPDIAIRELIGNAIIHQDFSIRGTGPVVEIFDRRVEVTNPGKPLIDPIRFIDGPPRSRNEALAAMARRLNMCEEYGDRQGGRCCGDFPVTATHI